MTYYYGTFTPDDVDNMAPNVKVVKINPARLRIWINRLPFCTRIIVLLSLLFTILSWGFHWLPVWGALIPSQVNIWTAYRLNTFPIACTGILHLILTLAALTPLLERFESEHGTLVTLALFTGPFSTIPGLLYIILEHLIGRGDVAVQGGGVWIFILVSCEAVKIHRANPAFKIGEYAIPTYLFPLPLLIIAHFLLPYSLTADSIILNLCSCALGYAFELGYLKFLVPPEWALRFIEGKLNLLGRLPRYVSVDQKTFGRYGVLPTTTSTGGLSVNANGIVRNYSPARVIAVTPSLTATGDR